MCAFIFLLSVRSNVLVFPLLFIFWRRKERRACVICHSDHWHQTQGQRPLQCAWEAGSVSLDSLYLKQSLNSPWARPLDQFRLFSCILSKVNESSSQGEVWPGVPDVPQGNWWGVCGEVLPSPNFQGQAGSSQRNWTDELSSPPKTGPVSGCLWHTLRDGHGPGVVSNCGVEKWLWSGKIILCYCWLKFCTVNQDKATSNQTTVRQAGSLTSLLMLLGDTSSCNTVVWWKLGDYICCLRVIQGHL